MRDNSAKFRAAAGLASAAQSLYGDAAFLGNSAVSRISHPVSSRWAVILLTAATLALAGCGRKGPLDLPPNAPTQPTASQDAAPSEPGSVFNPTAEQNREPTAAKGRKRSFVLDPILD